MPKIHDYMDNNKNSSVDLVSFTNGNQVYPKYQMNILNNEMSIFVGDKLILKSAANCFLSWYTFGVVYKMHYNVIYHLYFPFAVVFLIASIRIRAWKRFTIGMGSAGLRLGCSRHTFSLMWCWKGKECSESGAGFMAFISSATEGRDSRLSPMLYL